MDKKQSDDYRKMVRSENLHFPSKTDPQVCGYCGHRFDTVDHINKVFSYSRTKPTRDPPEFFDFDSVEDYLIYKKREGMIFKVFLTSILTMIAALGIILVLNSP